MVSTRPLPSKSSSPFNNPLVTVPEAPIINGINVIFMFQILFISLARSLNISFFSFSFDLILWSAGTAMSTILTDLVVLEYNKVWSSDQDYMIRFYVKIPLEFMCFILQERCLVMYIPFVLIVKFTFLAQLPVDLLAHPIVSTLIHIFVSITT